MNIQQAAEKVNELQLGLLAGFGTKEHEAASSELRKIWSRFDKENRIQELIQEVDKLAGSQ